jgi:ligand-binding sensor domain-containing protein
MLLRHNYNPIKDGAVPDSLIDTTDQSGNYTFTVEDAGLYNIQATHIILGKKALITDVPVTNATNYSPLGILKDVGAVRVFLPDTIDRDNGYIYVQGTTINKSLKDAIPVTGGGYEITMESMPEATITGFSYTKISDPDVSIQLSDTLQVIPNDTIETEAFIYWAHHTFQDTSLNNVQDVFIASDGALWVGTINGAAKFDGSVWTVYNTANSGLPINDVIEITADNSGTLWFCTYGGGVASFDGSSWQVYSTTNSPLPSDIVSNAAEDSQGNMWFSTHRFMFQEGGITKFDGTTWQTFDTLNSGISSNDISYLTVDNNDNIWFSSIDGGVGSFDGVTWTIYDTLNSGVPINQACRVHIDNNGDKWFGHWFGLITRFNGSTWTIYDYSHSSVLFDGHIYDIMEDTDGNIWVGTDYGVTKFDGTKWNDFAGKKYTLLENKVVYSVVIDKDGNTWVGTLGGGVIAFGPTMK